MSWMMIAVAVVVTFLVALARSWPRVRRALSEERAFYLFQQRQSETKAALRHALDARAAWKQCEACEQNARDAWRELRDRASEVGELKAMAEPEVGLPESKTVYRS